MTIEEGLDDLELEDGPVWELGGLRLHIGDAGDEGLDDVAELEGEDEDAAGDGTVAGWQRLASRPITLNPTVNPAAIVPAPEDPLLAVEQVLDELRKVVSPLPNRRQARLLRWRRGAGPAKRIAVRPAKGQPLQIPGGRSRVSYGQFGVTLRLEAPDPVILSDHFHTETFTAGETKTIVNAGSFTAVRPGAWWLTAPGGVTIENLDFDEYVRFPSGPLTVSRTRDIVSSVEDYSSGICYGPGDSLFPRWPLLRPGDNTIKASAACTLYWRDTW